MKNENKIKRAFAMEVIEKLDENKIVKKYSPKTPVVGIHNKATEEAIEIVQSFLPKEEEVDWYKKPFEQLIGVRFRDVIYPDCIVTISYNHTIETDNDGDVYLSFGGDSVGWIKQHGVLAEIVEPETKTKCSGGSGGKSTWTKTESERHKMVRRQLAQELKEHEETESDDVKAGDEVECKELVGEVWERGYIYLGVKTSTGLYVVECEGGGVGLAEQIRKPQPTLEQRARKKAEEMYYKIESSQEAIYQALLIDPKKL